MKTINTLDEAIEQMGGEDKIINFVNASLIPTFAESQPKCSYVPKINNAWSWVGLFLSLALNVFAGFIVYWQVSKPEVPLQPPCIERTR